MIRNLLAFGVAAVREIGGCFAFWIWLRRGGSLLWAAAGAAVAIGGALIIFGFALQAGR